MSLKSYQTVLSQVAECIIISFLFNRSSNHSNDLNFSKVFNTKLVSLTSNLLQYPNLSWLRNLISLQSNCTRSSNHPCLPSYNIETTDPKSLFRYLAHSRTNYLHYCEVLKSLRYQTIPNCLSTMVFDITHFCLTQTHLFSIPHAPKPP